MPKKKDEETGVRILTKAEAESAIRGAVKPEAFGLAMPVDAVWSEEARVQGRIGGMDLVLIVDLESAMRGSDDSPARTRRVKVTVTRAAK